MSHRVPLADELVRERRAEIAVAGDKASPHGLASVSTGALRVVQLIHIPWQETCCSCTLTFGLQRVHKLFGADGSSFKKVERYCGKCGVVPALGATLDAEDLQASQSLDAKIKRAKAAVAAKTNTTAKALDMPEPFEFNELGVVHLIHPSAQMANYPTAPVPLKTLLMSQLGLSHDVPLRKMSSVPCFPDGVAVSEVVTVDHIFEPDPFSGRTNRIDPNHLLYWPLTPFTLSNPYEIWQQQEQGRSNKKMWAFLAAYLIDGQFVYHAVFVNRQRVVRTSYRLNGQKQADSKRAGRLIYVAY